MWSAPGQGGGGLAGMVEEGGPPNGGTARGAGESQRTSRGLPETTPGTAR